MALLEVNQIAFIQILNYFEGKEVNRTTWYIHYECNTEILKAEFVLFLNSDKDDSINVLDVSCQKLLSKEELLLKVSPVLVCKDLIKEIEQVEKVELNLMDKASEDEIVKGLFGLNQLNLKGNSYLESFEVTSFLFNGAFNNIFQTESGDGLLVPLFAEDEMINFYHVKEGVNSIRLKKRGGYYLSALGGEESSILYSFNFDNVMHLLQKEMYSLFLTVIPDPDIDYIGVNDIETDLGEMFEKKKIEPIMDKLFIYNSNVLYEMISLFKYFINYSTQYSDYSINLEITKGGEFLLQVLPPKEIAILKVVEFFAGLNIKLYDLIGLASEDKEETALIRGNGFENENIKKNKKNIQYLSFYPKAELIIILIEQLNDFVFSSESKMKFVNVSDVKAEDEGDESFTSLYDKQE